MNGWQTARSDDAGSEREFLLEAPLLKDIARRLAACQGLEEWAILRAQQAIYLARTVRLDEAAKVAAEIRARFVRKEDPEVYYWIWLLEGVVGYYRSGTTVDAHFLHRAHSVATSLRREELVQYAAAWLANASWQDGRYADMARWLGRSGLRQATLPEAVCRACIIMATACQYAGDDHPALEWFAHARETARRIGDRATIMASIENRAFARLDRAWLSWARGELEPGVLDEIEGELLGALQYERITGSEAFAVQGDVARIRLHVMRGQLSPALEAIGLKLGEVADSSLQMVRASVVLKSWLRSELQIAGADAEVEPEYVERDLAKLDDDDACVCWHLLSRIAARLGADEKAHEFARRSQAAYDDHVEKTRTLRALLAEVG